VVYFTTGRGPLFGAKPVPSNKLATSSEMAARMSDDIDFDCGPILAGDITVEQAGHAIYDLILDVAGGARSASERNGFGDFEFVPSQLGFVL
jgi:altronate dehydratase